MHLPSVRVYNTHARRLCECVVRMKVYNIYTTTNSCKQTVPIYACMCINKYIILHMILFLEPLSLLGTAAALPTTWLSQQIYRFFPHLLGNWNFLFFFTQINRFFCYLLDFQKLHLKQIEEKFQAIQLMEKLPSAY